MLMLLSTQMHIIITQKINTEKLLGSNWKCKLASSGHVSAHAYANANIGLNVNASLKCGFTLCYAHPL